MKAHGVANDRIRIRGEKDRTLATVLALTLLLGAVLALSACGRIRRDGAPDVRDQASEAEGVSAAHRPALPKRGPGLASLPVFPALDAPLRVVVTQPEDGASDVTVDQARSRIAVRFNHPVIAVGSALDADAPSPIHISPELRGAGRWLDTSTYVFEPDRDLAGATRYTVRVGADLADLLGNKLGSDVSFSFQTVGVLVGDVDPYNLSQRAGARQPVSVTFNQAMDHRSVQAAFRLAAAGGQDVQGSIAWNGHTMVFTPARELERGATYNGTIVGSARASEGDASLGEDFTWRFTVAPRPSVVHTQPADGATDDATLRDGAMRIVFNTPMASDPLTVTIQPTIANQSSWWEANGREAHIGGSWLASQAYTVTVPGSARSAGGDPMGRDAVVRFTTAPIEPWFSVRVPGDLGLYPADRPQVLYIDAVNETDVELQLSSLTIPELLGIRLGDDAWQAWGELQPPADQLVRRWTVDVSADRNVTRRVSTTLASDGSALAPGTYLLRSGDFRYVAVVSELNLTLKRSADEILVWATRMDTGRPAGRVPIAVYRSLHGPLAEGVTDADGLFRAPLPDGMDGWVPLMALSVRNDRIEAVVGTDWSDGIDPWSFQQPYDPGFGHAVHANLYTDRPIYRAGQTVYYRAVLRSDDDGVYELPAFETVRVVVRDPNWDTVLETESALSEFGTLHGEIALSTEARLGQYTIELSRPAAGDDGAGSQAFEIAQANFRVSAYRKPEYEVVVDTDHAEYTAGDTIRATVAASYYFGGAVSGASVHWRLLTDDFFFSPEVDGWWDWLDYDLMEDRYYDAQAEVVTEGEGVLDAEGRMTFEVPADLSEVPLSQVFTFDVEVTDINHQVVAARAGAVVHTSQLYLGLRPKEYVGVVGSAMAFDIMAVDPEGMAVAGQRIDLTLFERTWYSVREKREDGQFYWTSAYTDTVVARSQVTSDDAGRAAAELTPRVGGVHRLEAVARDAGGRDTRSATYAWVTDRRFVNWRQENNRRISLVADRKSYEVGQTARVLVPAPFEGAQALVTVERAGIRDARVLRLEGNSETLSIPIGEDFVPNAYVSVVLVKGAADGPPDIVVGYTNLNVSAASKQLDLEVTTDRAGPFGPRDTVTYRLRATDRTGRPVQAEMSAALVDEALLALADDTSVPLTDAFYSQRALGVATSASLVRSAESLNADLAAEKKGGGGGLTEEGTVRRLFRDTAYWNGAVETDEEGRARFDVELPDNLTTWRLDVRAVTGADTLVGTAEHDIVSTKPMLVRPVLPRFLVLGDTAQLETVVNNGTERDLDLDLALAVTGLQSAGPSKQPLRVAAGGKAKVVWQVEVQRSGLMPATAPGAVGEVQVQMGAKGGGYDDTVEVRLPVYAFADPEVATTSGEVRDDPVTERFTIPADAMPEMGTLTLSLAGSLAAATLDSLEWLDVYPYDCSEQTTSKFLANVAVVDALDEVAPIADAQGAARREAALVRVRAGAERLYALQQGNGSWGWWGSDEGQPELTAYALYGLLRARRAGFPVSEQAVDNARTFLLDVLDRPIDGEGALGIDTRAFVVFVLSELGDLAPSRAVAVYDRRDELGIDGLAFLAMALHNASPGESPRIAGLLAEIGAAADVSASGAHWTDPARELGSLGGDRRSTAVAILALARLDPDHPNLAPAVRWLMSAREAARWETTYDTAWSVLALAEHMRATGELQADFAYHVELGGAEVVKGRVGPANVAERALADMPVGDLDPSGPNDLVLRKDGAGVLYYSALLRTYRSAESLPPEAHGMAVGRQYFAVDPKSFERVGEAVDRASIGDVMQVLLTLIVPEERHYVVVEDPIPAGFEIVDTTLKTTSAAARSPEFVEVEPGGEPQSWWERSWWSYWVESELRDEKVALFADSLDPGTYQYTYLIRAGLAGSYHVIPARAEEMYRPEVHGHSAGGLFTVEAP